MIHWPSILHDDIVVERRGQEDVGLVDVEVVGIDLREQDGMFWIGDVVDVDVGHLHRVLGDEVGVLARRPHEHAVGHVRVPRRVLNTVHGDVAEVLGQLRGVLGVRDVPQAEAGLEVLAAGLLVDGENVAGELVRLDVEHLHPLAGTGVLAHRDECHLFRVVQVTDVDDPDTGVRCLPAAGLVPRDGLQKRTIGPAPVRQVGEVLVRIDGDVGDQLWASAADHDLVDELDLPLFAGPGQVSRAGLLLSGGG
jgi:hypothetical protein